MIKGHFIIFILVRDDLGQIQWCSLTSAFKSLWQAGTIWESRDQTQVDHVQSKCPPRDAIAPAPIKGILMLMYNNKRMLKGKIMLKCIMLHFKISFIGCLSVVNYYPLLLLLLFSPVSNLHPFLITSLLILFVYHHKQQIRIWVEFVWAREHVYTCTGRCD